MAQNDSNSTDDSESMDYDQIDNTQITEVGTPGGPPGGPESVTDIYCEQFDQAQHMLQHNSTSPESVEAVALILKQSAELCKKEKKIRESIQGNTVLSLCAQISKNQAQSLDTNLSSFDVQCFADGILGYIRSQDAEDHQDWSLLAKRASAMFKRAPSFSYMYGSFKATELPRKEPKERVKRQTNRAAAEKKEPEKVTTVTATDEGNDKAVHHLKKVLQHLFKRNGYQPIGFFDCVLDPDSFHKTVENIFHLSFLMKNNFCAVRQENGGLPYIYFVRPAEVNELQKGKKLQCIMSISPEMWQTLLKVFNIKQAMVPPMN